MAQQYQTGVYPGQPQMMGASNQVNLNDPRSFDGIQWSPEIQATVKMGVPAWGSGQFSSSTACLAWAACFVGVAGMHRIYLGETIMGIVYCLTGGLCGIGQLIDGCSLSSKVEARNAEIRSTAQQRAATLATQHPQVVVQMGQPMVGGQQPYPQQQPGYSQPAYPAQQYSPQAAQNDPSKGSYGTSQ
ncbi:putative TM2 domain [Monocercomonoides exilis]|uniref:putative TM2 domain n=1 Tax=Monocercomonoides exilis TaxID=2049356 RepID=UPI0035596E14|nr:putative TM2 domain [Monocercomonoides exilis]|eukprot:MONOS_1214.1-p1 / transcript=MONOS_1214.1 / gene=MONOS_1214 / organism=Monocercomonoides_exilis_PA203 / gene_product=unspecified product / transcript_product=unspecified product / location=Mono_scaffold00020:220977-221604(+) / protein_length=186 / sequence_SO=supercontig / SO=protein_coding / is_pseudo=false